MTIIHLAACIIALVTGGWAAWLTKGSILHRCVGWCYLGATLSYAAASFGMYPSTGQATAFHAISVQSVILVVGGVVAARLSRTRGRSWRVWHLRFMLYSYVALVVTGLRFVLPALSPLGRLGPFVAFAVLPLGCWWWIERRVVPRWRGRGARVVTAAPHLQA